MTKSHKNFFKVFGASLLFAVLILAGSCNNWMSNDDFMEKIESEVHDANAKQISVYVRYANQKMGNTEPQGNSTFKVDVNSKITAVTAEDYGFVKWAAFSTNDFATNKQHSNLNFISQADYDEKIKKYELPETVVKFTDPKSSMNTKQDK